MSTLDAPTSPRLATVVAITPRAFAFCDIVGSTELAERLGDRRFAALITEHNQIVRSALGSSGSEAHFLGDGFMVSFDDGAAALDWAIAVQRQVGARLPGVRVRIGLHTGVAARVDGSWLGRDVIVARRLCERAGAGEVLVSERLRALVAAPARAAFGGIREVALKGWPAPQRACTVAWA
jgi:adenylate cyclase